MPAGRRRATEAYKYLSYASEDHNKIAFSVQHLRPSMQGLAVALSGAWSTWRDRVKDLVAIRPYHPFLFEGKQSRQGMCQLWNAECRCDRICQDCGKPRHGSFPFCMLWDADMCDCYPIMGVSSDMRGSWMDRGVRGWRPAQSLARRLVLRQQDDEARTTLFG